jgi:hypothetical protein
MRKFIVLVSSLLCGWAMWRPSLRDIGIALVVVALVWIAGLVGWGSVLSALQDQGRSQTRQTSDEEALEIGSIPFGRSME